MCAPPAHLTFMRVRGTPVCPHSRRTALLLIGAPLVSGFASMSSTCGNNDDWLQTMLSNAPPEELGGLPPSAITCDFMTAKCGEPSLKLICAGTCDYRGACTGDDALALLFAPNPDEDADSDSEGPPTCASLPMMEAFVMALGNAEGNEADFLMLPP